MAAGLVYVKFRAQLSWDPISFDGHFISVGELKRLVCDKKSLGDAVAELVLSDPSGSEYSDDSAQIPKGSRVLLRRVPQNKARVLVGSTPLPAPPTLTLQHLQPAAAAQPSTGGGADGAAAAAGAADEFGADPFAQSAASLQQEQAAARNLVLAAAAAPAPAKPDRPGSWGMGGGRGGPGAAAGRAGGGRGRGPAAAYICRRCGEAGKHWEKDCPTVGDPAFDYKTLRMPTGIPVTKLEKTADGSLYLPTGQLGQLASNRAAFAKELALMTGAAAAEDQAAEAAEGVQQQQTLLALPAPAGPAAAVAPVEAQGQQQQQQSLDQQPGPAAAVATPPAQADQQPAGEADLFGDDEPDLAAPIPITLGGDSADQQGSQTDVNSSKALHGKDMDPAEAWELFQELRDVLPAGTTLELWKEAFAIPQPLSAEAFERLQDEQRAAAAAAAAALNRERDGTRPSRASVEREQQHSTLSRSWSRDEVHDARHRHRTSPRPSVRPSGRRSRSRSRPRSRSRDRKRTHQRSPSRGSRRTPERSPSIRRRQPSLSPPPQESKQNVSRRSAKDHERRDTNKSPDEASDGGRRRERSLTVEDSSKVVVDAGVSDRSRREQAAEAAGGRKRQRALSREGSREDLEGNDRSRHDGPSSRARGRTPEPVHAARSSSPSAADDAHVDGAEKDADSKKKKKHKKDKKHKEKDKRKRKARRESRSRSRSQRSRSRTPSRSRSRSRPRPGSRFRSPSRSPLRVAGTQRDAARASDIVDRYIPSDPFGNGGASSSDDERSGKRKGSRKR